MLKWIAQRVDGLAEAVETPIGFLPAEGSLDVEGLAIDEADLRAVVSYTENEWRDEVPRVGPVVRHVRLAAAPRARRRAAHAGDGLREDAGGSLTVAQR